MYIGKVVRIGNSLGVVLPAPMRRAMGVHLGSYVQMDEAKGELNIRSNDAKTTTLAKRLEGRGYRLPSQRAIPK